MSSENNAENRNNIFPNILTNRRMTRNYRQNYCSFCNGDGHNIKSCNDTRITDFESDCIISKNLCDTTTNSRETFKQWLLDYYIDINGQVIKAFSVRKCKCRLRDNIDVMIEQIIKFIYENEDQYDDDENEIVNSIPFPEITTLLSLQDLEPPNKFNIATNIQTLDENHAEEICECGICYEDELHKKNFIILNCQHKFCKDCFKGCLKNTPFYRDFPRCALCRENISEIIIHSESIKVELSYLLV